MRARAFPELAGRGNNARGGQRYAENYEQQRTRGIARLSRVKRVDETCSSSQWISTILRLSRLLCLRSSRNFTAFIARGYRNCVNNGAYLRRARPGNVRRVYGRGDSPMNSDINLRETNLIATFYTPDLQARSPNSPRSESSFGDVAAGFNASAE